MKFYCIGDEDTMRGFRLAGIEGTTATTAQAAATSLRAAVADPSFGIIIISESVADFIRPQLDQIRLERATPLIVEIAGPKGWSSEHKGVDRVFQTAIGMASVGAERIRN